MSFWIINVLTIAFCLSIVRGADYHCTIKNSECSFKVGDESIMLDALPEDKKHLQNLKNLREGFTTVLLTDKATPYAVEKSTYGDEGSLSLTLIKVSEVGKIGNCQLWYTNSQAILKAARKNRDEWAEGFQNAMTIAFGKMSHLQQECYCWEFIISKDFQFYLVYPMREWNDGKIEREEIWQNFENKISSLFRYSPEMILFNKNLNKDALEAMECDFFWKNMIITMRISCQAAKNSDLRETYRASGRWNLHIILPVEKKLSKLISPTTAILLVKADKLTNCPGNDENGNALPTFAICATASVSLLDDPSWNPVRDLDGILRMY